MHELQPTNLQADISFDRGSHLARRLAVVVMVKVVALVLLWLLFVRAAS